MATAKRRSGRHDSRRLPDLYRGLPPAPRARPGSNDLVVPTPKETVMSISLLLLILLILLLVGALPTWGHSRNWGYGPSGGLGLVVLILVVLLLMGKI
jgi:hypothetical protein